MSIIVKQANRLLNIQSLAILLLLVCVYWPTWFHTTDLRIIILIFLAVLGFLQLVSREKLLLDRRTIVIALLTVIFSLLMGSPLFLVALLVGYINQRVSRKNLFTYVLVWSTTIWLITVTLSLVGITHNLDFSKINSAGETISRFALGFQNPNTAAIFLLPSLFSMYYLAKHKKPLQFAVKILAIMVPVYLATNCDSALIISICLVIINYLQSKTNRIDKAIKKILPYSVILFAVISILIGVAFGQDRTGIGNEILSNRPYFINLRITDGSIINLFGNADNYGAINNNEHMIFPLDNLYIRILVYGGIIAFFIMFATIRYGSNHVANAMERTIILLILVHGIIEYPALVLLLLIIVLIITKLPKSEWKLE